MNNKLNYLIYIALFSILGLFSQYLILIDSEFPPNIMESVTSVYSYIYTISTFNILGFTTIKLSSWLNEQLFIAKKWRVILTFLIVAFALFVLNYGLTVTAKLLVGTQRPFVFPNGGMKIIVLVWFVELIVMGLIIMNQSIRETLKLQRKTAELQQQNDKANYIALQNQLNPHFLFNSLNTLIAEIEYDPKNAIAFTQKLSDVYRYVLQSQKKTLVTLEEEIDFMNAYIFLHKVRLGDCITIINRIDDECRCSKIPPLTLQLLVENVIKHNYINEKNKMLITLTNKDNSLEISNNIKPKISSVTSGTGLKNLSERYKLITKNDIEVIKNETIFTVKVPIMYE